MPQQSGDIAELTGLAADVTGGGSGIGPHRRLAAGGDRG
jgi:hypothetical protein